MLLSLVRKEIVPGLTEKAVYLGSILHRVPVRVA